MSSQTTTAIALDAIPAAALLVQSERGIVDANVEAAYLLLGTGTTERPLVAIRQRMQSHHVDALRQIALGAEAGATERILRFRSDDGRDILVRARGKKSDDENVALVILDELPDNTSLEQTLAQSELLYDTFLRQAPTGIVHLDAVGNVTFENEQFRSIFGPQNSDRWMTQRADEIDELDDSARQAIRSLIADGTEFSLPRVRYSLDAERFSVLHLAGSRLNHPDGSRVGSVLMVLDQTEIFVQQRTIELRNRFRGAEVSLRKASSMELDEQAFLERAAAVIAEAVEAECVGIVVSSPHDEDFRIRAEWPLTVADAAGGEREAIATLLKPDQASVFWTPFLIGDEVAGFVAFRDKRPMTNTERTQLLQHVDELVRVFERQWSAVQLSYRYRLAVNSIEDGLFNYLLDPTGDRRYLFATAQFEGLFGIGVDAVVRPEKKASWLFAGMDSTGRKSIANHHAALAAGIASRTVFRFERPDGVVRWLREDASPQRDSAGRITVTGIVVDVTEQKDAEQMLDRAREAAEAEARRKTSFIATMSHELRTPLGTVHGFAEMIRRELEEQPSDSPVAGLIEFAGAIEERSGELLAVVEDLLDLSNVESGLLALSRSAVDLNALCREVLASHRGSDSAGSKSPSLPADLEIVLRDGPQVIAFGDPARIRKILDRVMSNAIKFTSAGTIAIDVSVDEGMAAIDIADEGVGMSEEQLERIFEPFVQGDDRLNRSFEGAGLGLTVAKRLAVAMGGEIRASSEAGVGTTIGLRLPLAADA